MNEVMNTQRAATLATRAASSKGAAVTPKTPAVTTDTGSKLPLTAEKPVQNPPETALNLQDKPQERRQDVEAAVASMNEFIQSMQRDLRFSVDEELDTVIIKVTDSQSGELIRQIPREIFLELARDLKENLDEYGGYGEFQFVNELS